MTSFGLGRPNKRTTHMVDVTTPHPPKIAVCFTVEQAAWLKAQAIKNQRPIAAIVRLAVSKEMDRDKSADHK